MAKSKKLKAPKLSTKGVKSQSPKFFSQKKFDKARKKVFVIQ